MSRRFTAAVILAAVLGTAIPLGVNEAVGRYEDAKARAGVIPAKAGPAVIERAFSKMKPLAEQVVGETPDGRPITVRLYSDPSGNLDWSVQLYVVGEPAPVPDPRNPHHGA